MATYHTVIGQPRASTGHSVTVASDFDGPAADGMSYRNQFSGNCPHHILTGIGHNVPQEAPNDFTSAVIDADSRS